MTKAVPEFSKDGIDKKSKAIVMATKTPAADAEGDASEVKVDSKVIDCTDEPGRPKVSQGVPIEAAHEKRN